MTGPRRRLLRVRERVVAQLRDGRFVSGIVMRTREAGRRVTIAFYDPHYRRADGQPLRIRRHRVARGRVRAEEEI